MRLERRIKYRHLRAVDDHAKLRDRQNRVLNDTYAYISSLRNVDEHPRAHKQHRERLAVPTPTAAGHKSIPSAVLPVSAYTVTFAETYIEVTTVPRFSALLGASLDSLGFGFFGINQPCSGKVLVIPVFEVTEKHGVDRNAIVVCQEIGRAH